MDKTQAESIRNAHTQGPWWVYLILTAFFVSYGLGRDLNSAWATVAQFAWLAILAGLAWAQWRNRRNRPSVASTWRMNDAVVWLVTLGFSALTLAVLFGGPHVLAAFGVPLPNTVSGLAVSLMLIAAIPLGPWSARRAAARAESHGPIR
jgi:hypothetical protein